MHGRDAAEVAAFHDIDDAPVGKTRDREPRHLPERRLVVERCGEHLARFGDEARVVLRALTLLEQPRVLDRDGRLRGQKLQRDEALAGEDSGSEVVLEDQEGDRPILPQHRLAKQRPRLRPCEVRVAGELACVRSRVVEQHALLRALHVVQDRRRERRRRRNGRGSKQPRLHCLAVGPVTRDRGLRLEPQPSPRTRMRRAVRAPPCSSTTLSSVRRSVA